MPRCSRINTCSTGFKNTLIILVVSIFFNAILGTVTAYIIERFKFRFKNAVVSLFFIGMLVPTFVTEIARFKIINGLGLYNTLGAPIVIYVASDLMQLYIYRQFISTIPAALDESALLDGCSYFGVFARIIFRCLPRLRQRWSLSRPSPSSTICTFPTCICPRISCAPWTTFLMDYANAQQGSWQTLLPASLSSCCRPF